MIRYKPHQYAPHKKRIDPLFVTVIAMLIFIPVLNACSTTPHSGAGARTTPIDTSGIETNSLQLPDGYEWDGTSPSADETPEKTVTSSFKKGTTMSFKADKNAPTSSRLDAIENQIALLRNDFNELYPSMRRLMAIEQDMQDLIGELKSLTTDVAAASAPPAAMPAPITNSAPIPLAPEKDLEEFDARAEEIQMLAERDAAPVAEQKDIDDMMGAEKADIIAPPPAAITPPPAPVESPISEPTTPPAPETVSAPISTSATVTGLRIGIHADIVRVVLDYTAGSVIDFKNAPNGQIFETTLRNTTYNGKKSWTSDYVPMVASYTVEQNGADAQIKFMLEPGTSLKTAFTIPADSGNKTPRLVIDFTQ